MPVKSRSSCRIEVEELLRLAEQADSEKIPDGMDIPQELCRRQDRLQAIAEAKAKIEERATQRYAQEQKEHEEKLAARKAKADKNGKNPRGRGPNRQRRDLAKKTSQFDGRRIPYHAVLRQGFCPVL